MLHTVEPASCARAPVEPNPEQPSAPFAPACPGILPAPAVPLRRISSVRRDWPPAGSRREIGPSRPAACFERTSPPRAPAARSPRTCPAKYTPAPDRLPKRSCPDYRSQARVSGVSHTLSPCHIVLQDLVGRQHSRVDGDFIQAADEREDQAGAILNPVP